MAIVSAVTLKYAKSFYDAKFQELEGYENQLARHLQTLEGLKNRIDEAWDSDTAKKYIKDITLQIIAVRNAQNDVAELKNQYQQWTKELNSQSNIVDNLEGSISSILSGISEKK